MSLPLIEEISLYNICLMISKKLNINYTQIASSIGCDTRTIARWRTGKVPYKTLSALEYRPLFEIIESACKNNGIDFVSLLTSWYPDLNVYHEKEEIKSVIKFNLDYQINGMKQNAIIPIKESSPNTYHVKEFLESCIQNDKSITSICMAFFSGWDWIKEKEKSLLLEQIDKLGINLRIIVNHHAAINKIAKSMKNPRFKKFYMGYNEAIQQWAKYTAEFNHLEFCISDYPILRKIYIVNYKDGSSEALVRNYAYDFSSDHDLANIHLNNNDYFMNIYKQEFEYLWKNAISFENWLKVLPKQEELFPSGEYLLLYLSHKKERDNDSDFTISALQVGENNNVKLDVNIADKLAPELTLKNPEYSYHGSIKMTRTNIYMTLFDDVSTEQISITICRSPLYEQNRFLGILTGLSPQAQPIACKCACIERSVLPNLNIQVLRQILSNHNKYWRKSLMILEENDINTFYSNSIFLHKSSC
jgi:hypothetical protein